MKNHSIQLQDYNYIFPKELIAQKPAHPRDSARLLVYNRRKNKVLYDRFINLAEYLPENAVLVFNQTKVVPARVRVRKATGGKAEILYLGKADNYIQILADRKLEIGSELFIKNKAVFRVQRQETKYYFLECLFPIAKIYSFLEKNGEAPLPPYIKHSPLSQSKLKQEYQTIFAKQQGSVAAPTASLHFSKRLLRKLKAAGIKTEFITLHVGLGTFAPVTEENLKKGILHTEWYEIPRRTLVRLNSYKKEKRQIIAVGTTVTRTLESASNPSGKLEKRQGDTNLFIQPGYYFKFVDGLMTNFHVPQSSLLILAAALVGRGKIMELYQEAIKRKFRLFSFGDGMLIV